MTIQTYGWSDLRMSIANAPIGAGTPTLTAFGPTANIKALKFALNDSVYLAAHFSHDILLGSTIFPHVHWSTDGTDVNTVKWQLKYTFAESHDTDNFPTETTINLEEAGAGSAWRHMITEDAVGFVTPDIDSIILCELTRITNGGVNNTDAVFGLFTDIHYQVGQVATPSRSPNFWA